MLMATCARSMRRISSASSSAPRAVNTRVSPIFWQRSWAGVPWKTDGKSSGTIIAGDLRSALTEGGLSETRPGSDTPGQPWLARVQRSFCIREGGLGRRDASAGLALVAEVAEGQLERRQGRQDVVRAGGHRHGADAQSACAHLVES